MRADAREPVGTIEIDLACGHRMRINGRYVLVSKYADYLPLYRQRQIFERDGLDLNRSTLADWVGKSTALLEPLADAIERQVLAAEAIFADDTPVSMLAPGTGRTQTARLWTYEPRPQ